MSIEEQIREAVREEFASLFAPYMKKLTQPEPMVYTVAEVATILAISPNTVYNMVQRGDLPTVPGIGRCTVPRWAVDDLLGLSRLTPDLTPEPGPAARGAS